MFELTWRHTLPVQINYLDIRITRSSACKFSCLTSGVTVMHVHVTCSSLTSVSLVMDSTTLKYSMVLFYNAFAQLMGHLHKCLQAVGPHILKFPQTVASPLFKLSSGSRTLKLGKATFLQVDNLVTSDLFKSLQAFTPHILKYHPALARHLFKLNSGVTRNWFNYP